MSYQLLFADERSRRRRHLAFESAEDSRTQTAQMTENSVFAQVVKQRIKNRHGEQS